MTVAMNDLSGIRPATRDFLNSHQRNFIDGRWQDAAGGRALAVVDPATGQTVSHVPDSDGADVDQAVAAARRAFEAHGWQRMKPAERERLLHRLADLMEANLETLAELESIDNGKTAAIAAAVDLPCAIDCLRFMAGMPSKLNGSTLKPSVPFLPDHLLMLPCVSELVVSPRSRLRVIPSFDFRLSRKFGFFSPNQLRVHLLPTLPRQHR